jgi:hypothetical protein
MALENKYNLTVNLKSKRYGGVVPNVTANDSTVFEIQVIDDAVTYPLLDTYRFTLVTYKKNKPSVIREGSLTSGGLVRFELGSSETTVSGKVEAMVQIYDEADNRISSAPLTYNVIGDPSLNGSLPADETTLVIANETLLTESIEKSEQAMARVDELITQVPQPSEVVDARGGEVTLGSRLNNLSSSLAQNTSDITQNRKYVSVLKYGAKGDGITDDTDAIEAAILASNGIPVMFPGFNPTFLITRPLEFDFYIELVGVGGSIRNIYNGKQSLPKIKYTGTGTFLKINGITVDPNKNHPGGSKLSNLTIEGTSAAGCAIKVNERDCALTEMRNVTFENVFVYNFTNGWAFELHEVYSPILINCNVQNCGGTVLNVGSHATTFIGGSYEQSAFGMYIKNARPVSFKGVTIEGISSTRPNCTIPSGIQVWDGWVGSDNPRPTTASYEGIGLVSIGSQVILDNCYYEANDWNVVGELSSHLTIKDSYMETDSTRIGSINFAGVYLQVEGNQFVNDPIKKHIYLEPTKPTYYCYINGNERINVTTGKLINTGFDVCGVIETEELWGRTIKHYNTRLSSDGLMFTPKAPSSDWNQFFVDPNDGILKFRDNTGTIRIVNLT